MNNSQRQLDFLKNKLLSFIKDLPTDLDFEACGRFDYSNTGNADDEQDLGAARSDLYTRQFIEKLLKEVEEIS